MPILAEIDGQVIFLALFILFTFLKWLGGFIGDRFRGESGEPEPQPERERRPSPPARERPQPPPTPRPEPRPQAQQPARSPMEELQDFFEEMAGPQQSQPAPAQSAASTPPPTPPPVKSAPASVKTTVSAPKAATEAKTAYVPENSADYRSAEQVKQRRLVEEAERLRKLREMIGSPEGLRTAWIVSEVLGKPRAIQN